MPKYLTIIDFLYFVYAQLGFKKAIVIELSKNNLEFEVEKQLQVYYDSQVVGDFFIDLFVEQEIIVELKSVHNLNKEHEIQLVNYLNGLEKEIGLLINFGPEGVEVKRKFRKADQKT